ncbi:LacI family DNA-binding transcriptional regulator [Cellulomonas sp. NPDC057328]|uniref:LacI family DNA-binding transcriptional regulator n=1 Tax=Cellulomonas sp. NPDC057328 TaxID=3346101 RepID=UPI00363ECD43
MPDRPTLKTVAAAAGVSTAQVSYAFNRPDRLSAASRAHILEVARQHDYAGPDATARSLRTGRVGAVGVIFTVGLSYAFSDPYTLAMLAGLTEVTERYRAGLVLIPFDVGGTGDGDAVHGSLDAVRRALIDGAVADGLADDHPAVQALARRRLPLVMSSASASAGSVLIDDQEAGRQVGRHLRGLGHRDVAAVVASRGEPGTLVHEVDEAELFPYSRLRLTGLRDGLGPGARVRVVSAGRNSEVSGRVAGGSVLDAADRPTAIAADSDVLAAAVLREMRHRGLRPGVDVSVTGFDDVPAAADAGLTTVRQPIREKGRLMGRMLLDPTFEEPRVILPTELVVRSSTGPAHD